jgi:hypothetical protein
MSQAAAKVKRNLEVALKQKWIGASAAEGQGALTTWASICNDLEASSDLRSIATLRRRELEGALACGDAGARELALRELSGIAAANLP